MPPFGVSSGLLHQLSTAPIIAAQNTDFCSAGGGVGSNLVLTGTNFTGATGVTVGGYTATIVSNTGTVLTVTTPSYTPDTVNGSATVSNVVVTTPHGTATTQIWFLPAAYTAANGGAWSMQDCTVSGGLVTAVADQSGNGYNLTVAALGGATPAYSATGGGFGGNLPYAVFTAGTSDPLVNTTFNNVGAVTAAEIVVAARAIHSAAFYGYGPIFAGSWPGTVQTIMQYSTETTLQFFNGGEDQTISLGSDFWADAYYSATSSGLAVNGGSFAAGGGVAMSFPGVQMGSWATYAPTYTFNGYIYQAFYFPTQLSSTGRTNMAAYFLAKGLG
jgi:hypothetical protein